MLFKKNRSRIVAWGSLLLISLAQCVYAQMPPGMGNRAISSGVITLNKESVPVSVTLSGQSLAEESATIRPLVGGVITDILYKAGDQVKKGDPLFQIDKETYEALLEVAKASLESAEVAVPLAEETYERYQKLVGTGASQSDVDSARAELAQAKAAVASAKADLKTAQINLNRTTVKSPIDGIVETANVSIGDLVTASQSDELTTVTKLDPITVDFAETSSRQLEIRRKVDSGIIKPTPEVSSVLILENGEEYEEKGSVETMSSSVVASTGTITVRAKFKNKDHLILPGIFLRARLTMGTMDGYLIPQLAAEPCVDGTISVWLLGDDNKAKEVYLTPQGTHDSCWIVTDGIEEGASLLVDNLDNITQGATVTPVDVKIAENGVIYDANTIATEKQ